MPICITGMHRSGTSMISRLLNLCGIYLGPKNELLPPAADNPAGFWENTGFLSINDRLLELLDARWDLAPAKWLDWEQRPEICALRKDAEALISRFNKHELWGWKDPRNSLTLPFWQQLIPDLKVLIVLRNPVEAVQSLQARGFSSLTLGLNLWLTHYRRILDVVPKDGRVVTHYDAFFRAPRAELRRVLDSLGIFVPDKTIDQACMTISTSLRHQVASSEKISAGIPTEVLTCYRELCEEAGPVYRAAHQDHDYVACQLDEKKKLILARDAAIAGLKAELSALHEQSQSSEDRSRAEIDRLQEQIARTGADFTAVINSQQALISELQDELLQSRTDSESLHHSQQTKIDHLQIELSSLNHLLQLKEEEREALNNARNEAITSLQEEITEVVTNNRRLSCQLSIQAEELESISGSYGGRLLKRYGLVKYKYLLPVYRVLQLWPYNRTGDNDQTAIMRRPRRLR